jgi:hypothetical protein
MANLHCRGEKRGLLPELDHLLERQSLDRVAIPSPQEVLFLNPTGQERLSIDDQTPNNERIDLIQC